MDNIKKVKFIKILIFSITVFVVISLSIFFYARYRKRQSDIEKTMPYNFETIQLPKIEGYTEYLTNFSRTLKDTKLYSQSDAKETKVVVNKGEYLKTFGYTDEFSKIIYDEKYYLIKDSDIENVSLKDEFKVIKGILLVNTKYKLPNDFNPGMDKFVIEQIELMKIDAKRDGIELRIYKDYIGYDEQKSLSKDAPKYSGGVEYSLYTSSGHNESQIGESIDVIGEDESKNLNETFKETKEYNWLIKNSHKYGFILRYPENKEDITNFKFEPWHFRFVGVENAKIIFEKNITLEEFLRSK